MFYASSMRPFLFFTMLFLCTFSAAHAATNCKELQRGTASWYGPGFEGRPTKSGEIYQPALLSAAHPTLPFGMIVRVINLENNRSVLVKINDRGAFKNHVIDVSQSAAHELGMINDGVASVMLQACSVRR